MAFHLSITKEAQFIQRKPLTTEAPRTVFGLRTTGPKEMPLCKRLGLEK